MDASLKKKLVKWWANIQYGARYLPVHESMAQYWEAIALDEQQAGRLEDSKKSYANAKRHWNIVNKLRG